MKFKTNFDIFQPQKITKKKRRKETITTTQTINAFDGDKQNIPANWTMKCRSKDQVSGK